MDTTNIFTQWEFWVVAWFFGTIIAFAFNYACSIAGRRADEIVEQHCNHCDDACDCERHHESEDFKEELRGDK